MAGWLPFAVVKRQPQQVQGGDDPMTEALLTGLTIFVLAMFVGFEVITKVPPTLHTPLMSGANAISGIALLGALLIAGPREWSPPAVLGLIAIVMATVNVVGGFLVTDRMLRMFQRERRRR
jgi:NAD(P) transhydrogenase subunit alpha